MIINTSSWHYRYIKFHMNVHRVKTLCQYIRKFILAFLMDCIILTVVVGLPTIFGTPIAQQFIAKTGIHIVPMLQFPLYFLCGILPILSITLLVFIGAAIPVLIYNVYMYMVSGIDKKGNPNPFVQYVKDKHNKMCSTITFKNK